MAVVKLLLAADSARPVKIIMTNHCLEEVEHMLECIIHVAHKRHIKSCVEAYKNLTFGL